jgi:hypothetical protein
MFLCKVVAAIKSIRQMDNPARLANRLHNIPMMVVKMKVVRQPFSVLIPIFL